MRLQSLLLSVVILGGCVSAYQVTQSHGGGGVVAAARQSHTDAAAAIPESCCMIPPNRGLHREQP